MLESKDILYIVLAFSALWITFMVSWFIYQIAMVMRSVDALLEKLSTQVDGVYETLNSLKNKFHEGHGKISEVAENVKDKVKERVRGVMGR